MSKLRAGRLIGLGLSLSVAATLVASLPSISASAATTSSSKTTSSSPYLTGHTVYPFTFTQANGVKVTIPKAPTRIVVEDNAGPPAEELDALGVKPIGGTDYEYTGDNAKIYGPLNISPLVGLNQSNYINLGKFGSPDLEAIAAVHPDLIVGDEGAETTDFTQLAKIAPVASLSEAGLSGATGVESEFWYPMLKLLAQILDRQSQFNAFVAKFSAALAAAGTKLDGTKIARVEPLPGDVMDVGTPAVQNCIYFASLGVTCVDEGLVNEASDELAGRLASVPIMLMVAYSTAALSMDRSLLAGPLFSRLPAVRAGRVYVSNGPTFGGIDPEGPVSELAAIPYFEKEIETLKAKT